MDKATRNLLYSQLSFFSIVILCIFIYPNGLGANNGISYYGTLPVTFPLYILACFSTAFFLLRATLYFPKDSKALRIVSYCLRSLVPFLIGILFTPYTYSPAYDVIHKIFGTIFFLIQSGLILWLSARVKWDGFTTIMIAIQLIGGLIALFSLFDIIMWEIEGQIIFQLVFGILLIRGVHRLIRETS